MASADKEAIDRLRNLSECCICLMTYTDPRLLPCFHTACLKCFEDIQVQNKKKPGDVLPCPLCRKEFSIPSEGMTGLQRNFFIESLMEVTNAFHKKRKSLICITCSMHEETSDVGATMRCLNCSKSYCPRCSNMHRFSEATKDHKIVAIKDEPNEEKIRNMFPIGFCRQHLDKALDYYCSDCTTIICVSCFAENHNLHDCKELTTVDEIFRQRIEESSTKMNDYRKQIMSKKLDNERQSNEFSEMASKMENSITRKSQEMKTLVDQHTQNVLDELRLIRQEHQKRMDTEFDEIERKLTVIESFVTYCSELRSKGAPSEVCGSAESLITRAKELTKENEEYLRTPSEPFNIRFNATDQNVLLQNVSNVIGNFSHYSSSQSQNPLYFNLPFQLEEQEESLIYNLTPFQNEVYVKEEFESMIYTLGREIENLEQELQKSKKVTAKLMKRNRILRGFYDQTLDRERKFKKELEAIKRRAKPGIANKGVLENVREALNPKLKSNEPKKKSSTSSSADLAESSENFVFGIDDGVSTSKYVIRINLNQSEEVSIAQRMSVEVLRESAAAVYCNSLFVTGIGQNRDEIWRLDAKSSTWMECASLVRGRRRHSVAFLHHILYICSGYSDSGKTVLDTVEAYDALCDECGDVGKLVFAVESSGNCIPYKSSIYVFGGLDANTKAVNRVQVFDTKSNTCTLLSNPMPRADSLLRVVLCEKTVILLGHDGGYLYNFETEVWEIRNQLKIYADYFGLAISNGLLFVIGGGIRRKGPNGNTTYICRDDVRCVPVMNILNDEPIHWTNHTKLPKPSLVHAFGKIDLFVSK